jgi:hypothetical protein
VRLAVEFVQGAMAAANDEARIHTSPAAWARYFENMISFLAVCPLLRATL